MKKKIVAKYVLILLAAALIVVGVVLCIHFNSEKKTPPTGWEQDEVVDTRVFKTAEGYGLTKTTKNYVISEYYLSEHLLDGALYTSEEYTGEYDLGGKMIQRSILVKETGVIFVYDFSKKAEGELTTTYNVNDFDDTDKK